jgi:hypothetical protein
MQRYNAGFVELRLQDVQLGWVKLQLDIAYLEVNGLTDPQPRTG